MSLMSSNMSLQGGLLWKEPKVSGSQIWWIIRLCQSKSRFLCHKLLDTEHLMSMEHCRDGGTNYWANVQAFSVYALCNCITIFTLEAWSTVWPQGMNSVWTIPLISRTFNNMIIFDNILFGSSLIKLEHSSLWCCYCLSVKSLGPSLLIFYHTQICLKICLIISLS
jgi:hypothetical protein